MELFSISAAEYKIMDYFVQLLVLGISQKGQLRRWSGRDQGNGNNQEENVTDTNCSACHHFCLVCLHWTFLNFDFSFTFGRVTVNRRDGGWESLTVERVRVVFSKATCAEATTCWVLRGTVPFAEFNVITGSASDPAGTSFNCHPVPASFQKAGASERAKREKKKNSPH